LTLDVRRASDGEVELVSAVLNEAAAWLAARGAAIWVPEELSAATLAPDVHAGYFYVGFSAGEAAGVLRLTFEDELFWPDAVPGEAAYVHRLAVRRAWAGAGTSDELLSFAAAEAKRNGCRYLRLDCIAARPKLRAIYERHGFCYHSDRRVGPYHVARYELELP
jgi:GNAT superfamily N-acetyltransferase